MWPQVTYGQVPVSVNSQHPESHVRSSDQCPALREAGCGLWLGDWLRAFTAWKTLSFWGQTGLLLCDLGQVTLPL